MAMQFENRQSGSAFGFTLVLLLHALLGWAVMSGTAQRMVDAVRQPLEVAVFDRPPPPPEPPPQNLPQPPPLAPPPPSYVPPPEIRIWRPPPPAPRITVQRKAPPPAPVVIAPAPAPAAAPAPPSPAPPPPRPAPAPPAPPLPPAPPPDLSRPARINAGACERPEYPRLARAEGATGVSKVRFKIDASGRVIGATVVQRSGRSRAHQLLDRAAVDALSGCRFEPGRDASGRATGSQATVEYAWRLEN